MNRADILSQFLVKLLKRYRDNKNSEDGNPVRTLLYLQLIPVSDGSKSMWENIGGNRERHHPTSTPCGTLTYRAHYAPHIIILSLLTDCRNTYALAVLPFLLDLAEGMIDLLQIETTSTTDNTTTTKSEEGRKSTMDDRPTSTNIKFPPLRRAALHFLTLLICETTKEIYESYASVGDNARLSIGLTERMRITVMAREALEDLAHLKLAKLTI
ncbi:hypothetical protein F5051DRAFT_475092 [Lentinula edodes]|nr:hypothetical protein F5051DRAFT_475092 [Lentinula edodes]